MRPEIDLKHVALWHLNSACNYNCRYCFGHTRVENPDVGKFSPQEIASNFDRTGFVWWIGLSGGEPFLYPEFEQLVNELTRKHFVYIDTNLSCDITKFLNIIDPSRIVYLNCAFHIEVVESRKNLDIFLHKVMSLREKGFSLILSSVAHPTLLGKLEKYISLFKSYGLILQPKIFLGRYKNSFFSKTKYYPQAFTDKQRLQIKDCLSDKISSELLYGRPSYKGKNCLAGKNFIRILDNGDVHRCVAENTSMGNIFKGELKLFSESSPCMLDYCRCSLMTYINVVEGIPNYREELSRVIHLNDIETVKTL